MNDLELFKGFLDCDLSFLISDVRKDLKERGEHPADEMLAVLQADQSQLLALGDAIKEYLLNWAKLERYLRPSDGSKKSLDVRTRARLAQERISRLMTEFDEAFADVMALGLAVGRRDYDPHPIIEEALKAKLQLFELQQVVDEGADVIGKPGAGNQPNAKKQGREVLATRLAKIYVDAGNIGLDCRYFQILRSIIDQCEPNEDVVDIPNERHIRKILSEKYII